jgi:hypothetical protein
MVFAQIKNGIVKNIIILDEGTDSTPFSNGFDFFKRIDNLSDKIGKNWNYSDPDIWTPPTVPSPDYQKIYEGKIQKAIDGFNDLLVTYAAANVLSGITQAGKTKLIADTVADVMRYGQSGSLYQAISALQAIEVTEEMSPFLTSDKINTMIQDTLALIASL